MREIKFRAWADGEMWDQNFTLDCVGGAYSIITEEYLKDAIIMQYTGLKDKNGVEIYEGDIVKCSSGIIFEVGVVYESLGRFCFGLNGNETGQILYDEKLFADVEVIGNIYENPKLLEQ